MTVKQIADVVGREERTVRNWIYIAAEKSATYLNKLGEATPQKPADFNEKEVFNILKAGLGEKMAGVYMYNSVMSKSEGKDMFDESVPAKAATPAIDVAMITQLVTQTVTQTVTEIIPRMFEKFESMLDVKLAGRKDNELIPITNGNSGTPSLTLHATKEGKSFMIRVHLPSDSTSLKKGDKVVLLKKNDGFSLVRKDNGRPLWDGNKGCLMFSRRYPKGDFSDIPVQPDFVERKKVVIKGFFYNGEIVFLCKDAVLIPMSGGEK